MKSQGSTLDVHLILKVLSVVEAIGIVGVVVKYVDINRNTGGEGG